MKSQVAGIILLRDDGAALLQHRDDKPGLRHAGMWVMPGGHCDPGETIEICARRELLEETAYDCEDLYWLSAFDDGEDPDCRCIMFWARYDGCQPVQCLEGQALKFVPRAQASTYPIPVYLLELWDMAIAAVNESSSAGGWKATSLQGRIERGQ